MRAEESTSRHFFSEFLRMVWRGAKKGLRVTYDLSKIMIPVYFIVTILKHTIIIDWIAGLFQPVTSLVGLPGEASLALVLGFSINLYAAIGAIASLTLTSHQITVIALILLICHSLPMEVTITKKLGVSVWVMLAVRFILGITVGIAANILL